MPLRDAMNELLAGLDPDSDPAEVLAAHGFEDLQPDAFSTLLLHFAEQSPMETADALAPIVTRVSPVPFEPGDLPPSPEAEAIMADGGDAFMLFGELAPTDADLGGVYADDDPSDFYDDPDLDDVEAGQEAPDVAEETIEDDPGDDDRYEPEDRGSDMDQVEIDDDHDDHGHAHDLDHDGFEDDQPAAGFHAGDDPDGEADTALDDHDHDDEYGGGGEAPDYDDGADLADEVAHDDLGTTDAEANSVEQYDGFDDLDELGDFDRHDHGETATEGHLEPDSGHHLMDDGNDDPSEIGFDLD